MALPLYEGGLDGITGKFVDDPVFSSIDKAESSAFNEALHDESSR